MDDDLSAILARYGTEPQKPAKRMFIRTGAQITLKCAKADRLFVVSYVHIQEEDRWEFLESAPVEDATPHERYDCSGPETVDMTELIGNIACYFCKSEYERGEYVLCSKCNTWVCRGRTLASFFRCGASCGGFGMISDVGAPIIGQRNVPNTPFAKPAARKPFFRIGDGRKLLK